MVVQALRSYFHRITSFRRNARLYLLHLALSGIAFGIYALLFNFYILSLGYDEALLGRLLTTHNTALLLGALPAGAIGDRLGRKRALLGAGLGTALAISGLVIWATPTGLFTLMGVMGLTQSLAAVVLPPFLMENSGAAERTYLFSASSSLQMLIGMLGFWIGGQLPGWLGGSGGEGTAYGPVLAIVAAAAAIATGPLFFLRDQPSTLSPTTNLLTPLRFAGRHPVLIGKFMAPVLVTALASGLFVPFMNIFYRERFDLDEAAIGSLFAAGSLAIGLGFLLAPPLAERLGKIRLVILTQILFIPALFLLGFAPLFWLSGLAYLLRVILMTMDDPIYQAFVMETVEENARATVISFLTLAGGLGWAAGPAVSGWLQITYGFAPIFLGVIALYVVAIFLTGRFFWRLSPAAGLVEPTTV